MPAKRPLYCPSCGSDRLVSIGSNGIEPNAGYTCQYCSQKLRRRGSGWFYVFMLILGLVMGPVGVGFLIFGFFGGSARLLIIGGIGAVGGLICFVYAILRLGHPVPLLERPQLDFRPPALSEPEPEPTEQPTPMEQPEPSIPVWRVIGYLTASGVALVREIEAESGVDAVTEAELNGMTVTRVDRVS